MNSITITFLYMIMLRRGKITGFCDIFSVGGISKAVHHLQKCNYVVLVC